jgi:high-affinity iron transporter
VQASLLTGMLGLQPHPVVIEVVGWLIYLIPIGLYVAWPPGRGPSRQFQLRAAFGVAALAAVGALVLALVAPGRPVQPAATGGTTVVSHTAEHAVVRTPLRSPAAQQSQGGDRTVTMRAVGPGYRHGLAALVYRATVRGAGADGRPARLGVDRIAALNGGRLPLGTDRGSTSAALHYTDRDRLTVWVEPRTGRVLDLSWTERVTATIQAKIGPIPLSRPVATAVSSASPATVDGAVRAAHADLARIDRHNLFVDLAWLALVLALLALASVGGVLFAGRRRAAPAPEPVSAPPSALVRN